MLKLHFQEQQLQLLPQTSIVPLLRASVQLFQMVNLTSMLTVQVQMTDQLTTATAS